MKKALQRILCLLTALTVCCSVSLISAAEEAPTAGSMRCLGDINGDGKQNAIDARWILQMASGMRSTEWYVYAQDGTYTPLPTYTCAEALRLVNAETSEIAQTGGYTIHTDCTYVKNVKLSSSISTWILNQLIETIV